MCNVVEVCRHQMVIGIRLKPHHGVTLWAKKRSRRGAAPQLIAAKKQRMKSFDRKAAEFTTNGVLVACTKLFDSGFLARCKTVRVK